MTEVMEKTDRITLLEKRGTIGESYCYLLPDGQVLAGFDPAWLKTYESADSAYAHFRPQAGGMTGHGAWNICYALENYLAGRDDGR